MERESILNKIVELIYMAFDENNYEYIRRALQMSLDYNSEHYGESEIYMAEDEEYVMVEDDIFYFEGRF